MITWLLACDSGLPEGEKSDPPLTETGVDTDVEDTDDTDVAATSDTAVDSDPPVADWPHTYWMDMAAGTVVDPPGVGGLIAVEAVLYLGLSSDVDDPLADTLDLLVAAEDPAAPGTQDLCSVTVPRLDEDWSSRPDFHVDVGNTTLAMLGFQVPVYGLTYSGTVAADGSAITDAVVDGIADTAALVPVLFPGGDPSEVCELLGVFGVFCQICPVPNGTDTCLSIRVEDLVATEVPMPELQLVSDADVAANPLCPVVP